MDSIQKAWDRILAFMKLPEQQGMTLISTISDYKNQDSKLTLLCGDCNNNFSIVWQHLRSGKRCNLPVCVNKRIQAAKELHKYDKVWQKVLEFFKQPEQESMILKSTFSDYAGQDTKLTIFCKNCNMDFYMSWDRLNLGWKCNSSVCLKQRRLDANQSDESKKIVWKHITDFFQEPKQKDIMELISTINDYQNQDTKLTIYCKICNGNYKMRWQNIRIGKQCNLDSCLSKRKSASRRIYTIEIINDKIFDEGDGDLLVSQEYLGYSEPLDIWCHKCGDIYSKDFSHWQRGERCPYHAPNKGWTIDEVKKFMLEDDSHDILETKQYTGTKQVLDIKCGSCDLVYHTNFHKYKDRNRRCLDCFGKVKIYTQKDIESIISADGMNTCVGKYIKTSIKIDVLCHGCDNIYAIKINPFINGHRCAICSHKKRGIGLLLSYDEVKQTIEECGEKLVSQTYTGMKDKLEILCHSCNNIYKRNLHSFKLNGSRCNICKDGRSQGEICVEDHLKKLGVQYKFQQRFDKCRNPSTNYMLPFDFLIFKPKCLIEFHGQQHYKWTTMWHKTEQDFKDQQERDKFKEQFAKDESIPLSIIPYWELPKGNVTNIIDIFLAKVKADEANLIQLQS